MRWGHLRADAHFGSAVLLAVALGTALHFITSPVRHVEGVRPKDAGAPDAGIILADPIDPPFPRKSRDAQPQSFGAAGAPSDDAWTDASWTDRERMERIRKSLKAAAQKGLLDDADRRMLRHVCKELRDRSCSE